MTDPSPPCAIVSLPDISIERQISCAKQRLVVIAPGLSISVAKVIAEKWKILGKDAVCVVLDPDPEVCRLGLGDLEALKILHEAATSQGTRILQQRGLRVGVIITVETTTIFSPTARLVEAGGLPGEKFNALRFDAPVLGSIHDSPGSDLSVIDLYPDLLEQQDVVEVSRDLELDPPVKFDLARKVRVFNAKLEFVEFELLGAALKDKKVTIAPDLVGVAGDADTQKLLKSTCKLIDDESELSGKWLRKLKDDISKRYLIALPGFGNVILRTEKDEFLKAVEELKSRVAEHAKNVEAKLQEEIDSKRVRLAEGLVRNVVDHPPKRWAKYLGSRPDPAAIERMLADELEKTFGSASVIVKKMELSVLFKGVTYESLNDAEFRRVAAAKIPSLRNIHDEFAAIPEHDERHSRAAKK